MSLLRSLAFNIWIFGVSSYLSARYAFTAVERDAAIVVARTWARWQLDGLRWICGIDYQVSGAEHLPKSGPALVAPMHQSAFDTMVWLLLVPDCVFIIKSELMRLPLFGRILAHSGMIPVDRQAGASAMRDLLRRATSTLAAGRQIVIFPEGTRVAPGEQVKLQPGIAALAIRSGLPVIPVVTDSGNFWARRAFRKRPGTIRIAVLPPLPVGLPRDELLTRLSSAYAEGYAALAAANPVEK